MKTIARINADGSLEISGEVKEIVTGFGLDNEIDDAYVIDEETIIDDEIELDVFLNILLGVQSSLVGVDELSFDAEGNLTVQEVVEGLLVTIDKNHKIEVSKIIEGVEL